MKPRVKYQIVYMNQNRYPVSVMCQFFKEIKLLLKKNAEKDLMVGTFTETFEPDTTTNVMIATILHSYAKYKGMDVSEGEDTNILSYTDAEQIGEWVVSAF